MAVLERPQSLGLALVMTVGSGVAIASLASSRDSVAVAAIATALFLSCLAGTAIWVIRRIRRAAAEGRAPSPQPRPLTFGTRAALVSVPVVLLGSAWHDAFTWFVIGVGGAVAGALLPIAFMARRDPTHGPFVGTNEGRWCDLPRTSCGGGVQVPLGMQANLRSPC